MKTWDEIVIGSADTNGFDKNIDKSIGNWSSLPKVTNPDVILLQKARGKMPVYFLKGTIHIHTYYVNTFIGFLDSFPPKKHVCSTGNKQT